MMGAVLRFPDPGQQTLDEYRQGLLERARDTGINSAERADAEWAEGSIDWITELPAGTILSGDDLRAARGTSLASGAVFRRAAAAGLIVKYDVVTSTVPSRHGALTQRWLRT
jgi:hypothetical protein